MQVNASRILRPCYHANAQCEAMAQCLGEEMGKKAVDHTNVRTNWFQGFGFAIDIKVEGVDEERL